MSAVLADMIDGAVLSAGMDGAEASGLHDDLWTGANEWLANGAGPIGPLRAVA